METASNDSVEIDRKNYADYVADRALHGGWSDKDVTEYRKAVGSLMRDGTEEDKDAAKFFWRLKAIERLEPFASAIGINERIRSSIEQAKAEKKEAA